MQVEMTMSGRKVSSGSTFEIDKAIAATGYLVERTSEQLYPIMKMMYLADKLHLERYGRFISGDSYSAMEKGPVPSCTYNMLKHVRGDKGTGDGFARAKEYFVYHPNHLLELRKAPDYDELSKSEIACLQLIVDMYKSVGKWAIRDMSHDDAWSKAWSGISKLLRRSVPMDIESIALEFEHSDALIQHLRDSSPGEAKLPKKEVKRKALVA